MKVKISFTLDVDAKAWAVEYGLDAREVREDVKLYIESGVRADLASRELLNDN
jgi:hypothetical protein